MLCFGRRALQHRHGLNPHAARPTERQQRAHGRPSAPANGWRRIGPGTICPRTQARQFVQKPQTRAIGSAAFHLRILVKRTDLLRLRHCPSPIKSPAEASMARPATDRRTHNSQLTTSPPPHIARETSNRAGAATGAGADPACLPPRPHTHSHPSLESVSPGPSRIPPKVSKKAPSDAAHSLAAAAVAEPLFFRRSVPTLSQGELSDAVTSQTGLSCSLRQSPVLLRAPSLHPLPSDASTFALTAANNQRLAHG